MALYADALELPLVHAGKVRELYALSDDRLLMVATDRISAFDYVLEPLVPDKGMILNQLSLWWFDRLADLVDNHVISTAVPEVVAGRAVVCERLTMVPVECVGRGYLTGSGWGEYQASGSVCGVALPSGLVDGSRLPEPIFTPTTKAPLGEHDKSIDFATVVATVGAEVAEEVRRLTLAAYRRAEEIARNRGIILADTKFEFGRRADGTIVLADEVLTPDSSRFWEADRWQPGSPAGILRQAVRPGLADPRVGLGPLLDCTPAPATRRIVAATRAKYLEAYERLTGKPFVPG